MTGFAHSGSRPLGEDVNSDTPTRDKVDLIVEIAEGISFGPESLAKRYQGLFMAHNFVNLISSFPSTFFILLLLFACLPGKR